MHGATRSGPLAAVVAPAATGVVESRDGEDWLVYTRRIRCSAGELWAAWTDPDILARWVGRSDRRSAEGPADFYFTFEGDDLLPMTYTLEHLEVGRSMSISTRDPGQERAWRLEIDLLGDAEVMVLRVAQLIDNAAVAPSIASGWEYYLDRLTAVLEGADPSRLDYDEYFLSQAEHYRALFPLQRGGRRG